MRKRLLLYVAAFVALLVPLSLSRADPGEETIRQKLVIGYSGAAPSVDYWRTLSRALFERARKLGVVVIDFSNDDFSLERQQKDIQQAIDARVDGFIIGAVSDQIAGSIGSLEREGIPVVAVNLPVPHPWVSATAATDNRKAATLAAEFIRQELSGSGVRDGHVAIFCGDQGQADALLRAQIPSEVLSTVGYVPTVFFAADWAPTISLRDALMEFEARGSSLVAAFACFAGASVAIVEAAEKHSLRPMLVGFDMNKAIRTMIQERRLDAAIVQDPARMGEIGIETMTKILRGDSYEESVDVPARLVTAERILVVE